MGFIYEALDLWALGNRKALKGKICSKNKKHAPFTHDLRKLAKTSNVVLEDDKIKWLDIITTFNLNARYDDYKQEFYKKCTKEFASVWIENIKELRLWIRTKQ